MAEETTASAPAEQAVENNVAQAPATETKDSAATTQETGQATTQGQADWQKQYNELRPQFTKTTQELSELRKRYSSTVSELQAIRKMQEDMAKQFSAMNEKPIDPNEFFGELQKKGPKALDTYFEKKLSAARAEYDKALQEQSTKSLMLEDELTRMRLSSDKVNYPDFEKLLPTIREIAASESCPVDFNRSIHEVYDALYKLARSQHSEEALKQAELFGQKKAEAVLAKEASTTVAGGGNAGMTVDPREIKDINKLRQYFVSMLGEAE